MATDRTVTPMNLLALAIINKLRDISARKDSRFITSPMAVNRLTLAGDFTGTQKPFLALTCMGWEVEPQAGSRFEGVMTFGVHCVTENNADAEGALLNLVSDVFLALAQDITLGATAMYLFPRSFEPNIDLINRTGLAITTVTYECRYKFDSTAP